MLEPFVEILVDANIQYLNDIQFGEKLICQKVLVGTDSELYNSNVFERSDLGLSQKRIIEEASHLFVNGVLNRSNQSALCFAESGNLLDTSFSPLAQRSGPTGTAQLVQLGSLLTPPRFPQ